MKLSSMRRQQSRSNAKSKGDHAESELHAEDSQNAALISRLAIQFDMKQTVVREVHSEFQRCDVDGGGTICREEFEQLIIRLYGVSHANELPASRIQQFWKHVDADESESIDFEEFLAWYVALCQVPAP